jgi:hypothetical protein
LPATVSYIEGIEDPAERANELAMLHYTRGILAAQWRDTAALGRARQALGGIDHRHARRGERALAAYALQLKGDAAEAVDSLDLDLVTVRWTAIHRLSASRWLLAAGDTARAAKLLSTCQWPSFFPHPDMRPSMLLAGHCYLELARIEDARGRDGLARKYYWQFLKRYDMPVEAHREMVEEAQAAYERVGGS